VDNSEAVGDVESNAPEATWIGSGATKGTGRAGRKTARLRVKSPRCDVAGLPRDKALFRHQGEEGAVQSRSGASIRDQLELLGFDEAARQAEAAGATPAERARLRRRLEAAQEIMTVPPGPDDLGFLHSGLCQTHLPRARPESDREPWVRASGRFRLVITPGVVTEDAEGRRLAPASWVGIPFGTRARLILIYLQTQGVRSRMVPLGRSMSAWIRSLGLPVTGGPRGTITTIREQVVRIARCSFSLQWTELGAEGGAVQRFSDVKIVDEMALWHADAGDQWRATVLLSERFHAHLRDHAVPLDQRAVAHLSDSALALDAYAFLAHRLPRLERDLLLPWSVVAEQFGGEEARPKKVAELLRRALVEVHAVYPDARVETTRRGLLLKPSPPSVPKTLVSVPGSGRLRVLPKAG
jgi:hypothetical protein